MAYNEGVEAHFLMCHGFQMRKNQEANTANCKKLAGRYKGQNASLLQEDIQACDSSKWSQDEMHFVDILDVYK